MTSVISDEQVDGGTGSKVNFPCVRCTGNTRSDLGQDSAELTFLGCVQVVWWGTSGEGNLVVLALDQWVWGVDVWFTVLSENDGCHGSTGQK